MVWEENLTQKSFLEPTDFVFLEHDVFKVTQISQMTQIFLDLFGQMTQIFPTAVTPKGYFRTKGDDVICRLCLAKLLYCGEVFDMHTLPEGIQ